MDKKKINSILIVGIIGVTIIAVAATFPVSWIDNTVIKQAVIKKVYMYPTEAQILIINGERFIETQIFFAEKIEQHTFSFKNYKDSLQTEKNVLISEEYSLSQKHLKAIVFKDSIYSVNKGYLVYHSNGMIKFFPN